MRKISYIASLLLIGNISVADTLQLKEGWNLVSIPYQTISDVSINDFKNQHNLSSVLTFEWSQTRAGYQLLINSNPSTFKSGQGYWIKSGNEQNITISTSDILASVDFKAGWNLVGLSNINVNELKEQYKQEGIKIDTLVTFEWSQTRAGEQLLINSNIDNIKEGQGYWVKVEKLAGTATTRDGYDIKLYVDSENADVSSVLGAIPNYNLTELSNISSSFSSVSNLVVSGTSNGQVVESSYIDPSDSSFSTALSDAKTSIDTPTQATGGTSIYVYGLSDGGAPYIISEAKVYTLNSDGTKGDYLGTTSQTGYLYLSSVSSGQKVWVEKDGFDATVATFNITSGSANYIFLTEDDGTGVYENTQSSDTTSQRIINRVLNAWNAQLFEDSRGAGGIATPANVRLKAGAGIRLYYRGFSNLPDHSTINDTIVNATGYNISLLGAIKVKAKVPGSIGYRGNVAFSDILEAQDGASINDLEGIIGVTLNDELKEKLYNDQAQYDSSKIADFKSNIVVYNYKDNSWQEIQSNNIEFKVRGVSSFSTEEQKFLDDHTSVDAIITINGTIYTGAYSLVALYKEAVNETPDVSYVTYGLNVIVKDENGGTLPNALIKLSRGNGGTEIINYTDSNGQAHFDLLYAEGAVENISLQAMEGSHYPVSSVLSISSLTPDVNNTITMQMEAPPQYATVKGEIKADDNSSVTNAKVELIYPIALANVQKDVMKLIDNTQVKGLQVGFVPNARYKWYIKAHSDDTTTQTSSRLNRVSEERWILVQSATSQDGGNFLPYSKVVAQALAAPLDSDPSDVQIIPTGQFDIAVQVEHDIDADGTYDFVELAKTDASQPNLSGEEFENANNNYGRILGFISTSIDIEKIIGNSGGLQGNQEEMFVQIADLNSGNWFRVESVDQNEYNQAFNYGYADENENEDDGSYTIGDDLKFYLRSNGYLFISDETDPNAHDYNSTRWDIALSATLLGSGSTNNKYVALQKQNDGSYKWVAMSSSADISAINDEDKFIFVQQDEFKGIQYEKIARVVSQNAIFKKLVMSIGDIANEAGIGTDGLNNLDRPIFEDGFNLYIIPTVTVTSNSQTNAGAGKVIKLRKIANIAIGGTSTPIKDYIKLDEVFVDRPVLTESKQITHSDRVGLYQFSAVPLSYGEMNNQNSLLRVESKKLGYYDSPVATVPKFEQDDTSTTEREDVKRIDLQMVEKPTFSVDVNVTDSSGNPINNAIVIMDGIKNENSDLDEHDSLKALEGSFVTFTDVIGGRGTNRVVRVSVPDSNYIPVVKTIRNLNSNEHIDIQLQSATEVADFAPAMSVTDSSMNFRTGIATIKLNIIDKNDDTTTVTEDRIYVYNNGLPALNVDVAKDGTNFTISLPLEVGQNEIVVEALNNKGISESSPVRFEYNPNIGSIQGTVRGFTDNDGDGEVDENRFLVLDIFDENGLYINTAFPADDGRYILEDLVAGESFKLQALEIELNNYGGSVKAISPQVPVAVVGGQIVTADLTLQEVQTTGVSGSPVIDFIGDLTQTAISDLGEMNVSATVSNFDPNGGHVGFVVNDHIVEVNTTDSTYFNTANADEHSYNIQNFPIRLHPGMNIIYAVAQNPDGSFEWSADIPVEWNPTDQNGIWKTLVVTAIKDNNQSDTVGAYVELFDENHMFVATADSSENNDSVEFRELVPGTYYVNVYPYEPNYLPVFDAEVNLNSETVKWINVDEFNETIEVADFYIQSIDMNVSEAEKGTPFTLTAMVFGADSNYSVDNGYSYGWSFIDESGTLHPTDCTTRSCVFNIQESGWYNFDVNVTKNGHTEEYSTQYYIRELVVPRPPSVPEL